MRKRSSGKVRASVLHNQRHEVCPCVDMCQYEEGCRCYCHADYGDLDVTRVVMERPQWRISATEEEFGQIIDQLN